MKSRQNNIHLTKLATYASKYYIKHPGSLRNTAVENQNSNWINVNIHIFIENKREKMLILSYF